MSGSGFDAVGVAGIITAIVAPLAAVMIAQQLSRRDGHQRLAMNTFYRMTIDVDRFDRNGRSFLSAQNDSRNIRPD